MLVFISDDKARLSLLIKIFLISDARQQQVTKEKRGEIQKMLNPFFKFSWQSLLRFLDFWSRVQTSNRKKSNCLNLKLIFLTINNFNVKKELRKVYWLIKIYCQNPHFLDSGSPFRICYLQMGGLRMWTVDIY